MRRIGARGAALALVAFSAPVNPIRAADPTPIVGVKIYETDRDAAGLFREWQELGINAVFASVALNRSAAFRDQSRRTGIARFVILPIFFDPEALAADPGLFAVTARGDKARASRFLPT